MIVALDSATPPSVAQVAAARAAGIAVWSGYLATKPNVGLLRPWSQGEFAVVRTLPGTPIAFCSGWDDPTSCKALAAALNVRLCLDVEGGIRGDGPWVQAWLAASGAGLYSYVSAFPGRQMAFAILADRSRTPPDPRATWAPWHPRPAVPCGWQWWGTHNEFGVTVDRNWLDDSFAQGGHMFDGNDRATLIKLWVGQAAAGLGIVLSDAEVDTYRVLVHDNLDNQQSVLAKIKAEHPVSAPRVGPTSGTISGTIKLG